MGGRSRRTYLGTSARNSARKGSKVKEGIRIGLFVILIQLIQLIHALDPGEGAIYAPVSAFTEVWRRRLAQSQSPIDQIYSQLQPGSSLVGACCERCLRSLRQGIAFIDELGEYVCPSGL